MGLSDNSFVFVVCLCAFSMSWKAVGRQYEPFSFSNSKTARGIRDDLGW